MDINHMKNVDFLDVCFLSLVLLQLDPSDMDAYHAITYDFGISLLLFF